MINRGFDLGEPTPQCQVSGGGFVQMPPFKAGLQDHCCPVRRAQQLILDVTGGL